MDVSRELGLAKFTERESSNYVNGQYLSAKCLGVVISISMTDDEEFADYPFHLCMDADGYWVDNGIVFDGIADLVARKLVLRGYYVVRSPDVSRVGAGFFLYSIRDGSSGNGRNEIEVLRKCQNE